MDVRKAVDIIEIQGLLAGYAAAVDEKNYDLLDDIFLPDARLTYEVSRDQIVTGDYKTIKEWIRRALAQFPFTEHLIGMPRITLDGDRAKTRTTLINPMLLRRPDRDDHLALMGSVYHDIVVRTEMGWRISERHQRDRWQMFPPSD